MSGNSIQHILKNQFLDKREEFCNDLIKKQQNDADNNIIKTSHDKLICVVCGGKYIRCNKSRHVKTKRHQQKLKTIHEFIFN